MKHNNVTSMPTEHRASPQTRGFYGLPILLMGLRTYGVHSLKPVAFALLIFFSTPAPAGDIATERTQAATLGVITILQTATAKIQGIVGNIEELETKAGELIDQIPGATADLPDVGDIFEMLDEVEGIMEAGTELAYSADNLEEFMRDRFQTYDDYLQAIRDDGGIVKENFDQRFREWNDGHRDSIRTILSAHGFHSEQIANEQARLETLERLSRTSQGRMQAAQVGHQIAIEEVKQMHKLRELLMEQSNLHASYFATKQAMEAENEAATTYLTERRQNVPIDNGRGY